MPVVRTLQDIVATGDAVHRIEGSLSGSLGFVCDQLNRGAPLDEAVREAMARGYTEPRPQEDLSGTDVARKALILARELGMRLDMADVDIVPLVPAALLEIDDPEEFVAALAAPGLLAPRTPNTLLRYLAVVDPAARRPLQIGPVEVPSSHPAAGLAGPQALVASSTRRYAEHPLVVQGPGAGGEVTASGVLADVLAIGAR